MHPVARLATQVSHPFVNSNIRYRSHNSMPPVSIQYCGGQLSIKQLATLNGVLLVLQAICVDRRATSSDLLDRPSQDSSVRIGTSLQAGRFGIRFPTRAWDFFLSSWNHLYPLWVPPSLASNQHRGLFIRRAKRPEFQA